MIHFIQSFFQTVRRAVSDFSFYTSQKKGAIWPAVLYLYTLAYVILLIQTLVVSTYFVIQLPELPSQIQSFQQRIINAYPDNLVISVDADSLSINQKSPVVIDVSDLEDVEGFDHVVVFDMDASPSEYDQHNSIVLVTDSSIVYPQTLSDSSTYEVMKIADLGLPSRITKESYIQSLRGFTHILDWVGNHAIFVLIAGVLVIPLIGSIFITMWRLLYLLIATVLLWSIAQMFRIRKGYWQVYVLGAYGLTVPILFGFILDLIGYNFSYAFMSTFLLWMVIVLSKFKR